ncbi:MULTISPECIES: arylesterase [Pseudomonas]|uniref:Multifunctional acyl-CoA thioesterase I and protease I and lysophospholipase L1 n=1 Tax=Pseudomonas marincola TaxID=437900 RepID=A0A1I6XGF9_9PSED|nr:arylesterase [Pseudomonas marincola]CAE6925098.1 multifunctional acyl-CoA thioesterase I and protease I and lysophospholipase L1 [Pseudomonas marincola]SFT37380.1 acyl-CoA thioesterase-1 [Pseudomonas marincola]
MQKRLIGFALIMLLWGQTAAASTVLVVGDSISAAFGLDTRQGWVALLQERMAAEGFSEHVVNASISGDTTAGGASRLPTLLQEHKPKVVVVELGGNDGLRGLAPVQMQQNLSSMIEQSKQAGAEVLLLGMQLPPNYGKRYTTAFANVFSDLAREQQVALVPFLLEGVGGVPRLMQADGIHPAAEAQSILLENVWPQLKPLL